MTDSKKTAESNDKNDKAELAKNAEVIEGSSSEKRRPFLGLFIQPRHQIRYSFMFFCCGVIVMTAFIVFYLVMLSSRLQTLSNIYAMDADIMLHLQASLRWAVMLTIVFATFLTGVTFALGIAITHRIFGPMVPIARLINDLKTGNYSSRGHIRTKDEFQDVMENLNQLASTLESRYGSQNQNKSS